MSWRYRRHPALCFTEVDGGGVVLHLGTRRYFTVSATGLEILRALDSEATAEELTAHLTERYEVNDEAAAESVTPIWCHVPGSAWQKVWTALSGLGR